MFFFFIFFFKKSSFILQRLTLPPVFFKVLCRGGNVQNIQLVSLYVTNTSITELENHFNNGTLNKLDSCHLEDLIIPDSFVGRFDNLMMNFIKRSPKKFSLTLCIQRNAYGVTLFNKLLESNIKVAYIHLMIKLNLKDEDLFKKITVLQKQCDKMSITFYNSYKQFRDKIPLKEQEAAEMDKWEKVIEVNVGKRLYPYLEEREMGTTERDSEQDFVTYLSLIANMHRLPHLRKFGLKDRVLHNVTDHLSIHMRNWHIEELTLALSRMHPRGNFEMNKYNELYASIPPSVSSLNLIFCPLDPGSLEALASLDPPLKNLTHFSHQSRNQFPYEVRAALPNCSIEGRRWMSPITTKINVISEFVCYLNKEAQ